MKLCPCHSKKRYLDCCGAFLQKKILPDSPESLMRSRYTAYVEGNINYIKRTMRGPALADFNKRTAKEKVQWLGLDIIHSSVDPDNSDIGYVEFKARYNSNKQLGCIHELSTFSKINHKWYYTSGQTLTDPSTENNHPSEGT